MHQAYLFKIIGVVLALLFLANFSNGRKADARSEYKVVVSVIANGEVLEEGVEVEVFIQSHPETEEVINHVQFEESSFSSFASAPPPPSVLANGARPPPTWTHSPDGKTHTGVVKIDPKTMDQFKGDACSSGTISSLKDPFKCPITDGKDYHCGHLTAVKMGGTGDDLDNVFCQSRDKTVGWDDFEESIYKCLTEQKDVGETTLTWVLSGEQEFPSSLSYSVKYTTNVGNCKSATKKFKNK